MILFIVSVKDSAAQAFGRPIFVPTVAVATRSFRDEVNKKNANDDLSRHPSDFELYEIGEFDDATGIITMRESPQLIVRAKDLVDPT